MLYTPVGGGGGRNVGSGEGAGDPVSIAIRPDDDGPGPDGPRPTPRDTIVDHKPGFTTISRLWRSTDDAARCRLCPRELCYYSEGGMCQVSVPGFVPTDLAPLWPLASPGLPRTTTARVGLWLDRPPGRSADGRAGEG